jgi:hypothetical protein
MTSSKEIRPLYFLSSVSLCAPSIDEGWARRPPEFLYVINVQFKVKTKSLSCA